jgi:hypothetical protein
MRRKRRTPDEYEHDIYSPTGLLEIHTGGVWIHTLC